MVRHADRSCIKSKSIALSTAEPQWAIDVDNNPHLATLAVSDPDYCWLEPLTWGAKHKVPKEKPCAVCLSLIILMSKLYEFKVINNKGQPFDMAKVKDKVVLVVNTASKCGFTPQFEGLESLYKQYKDKGLVIVGFPCNQFMNQDPGSDSEITSFCQLNYGVSFPMMKKIDVNGDNAAPIYQWLKSQKSGLLGLTRIKWNFEKFLIDRNGQVVSRYASTKKPDDLKKDIEKLL